MDDGVASLRQKDIKRAEAKRVAVKATRQKRLNVLKAAIQAARKDVPMRTQQNAVRNQPLLGVEHVIEAKSTLVRDLYREVAWHDLD